MIPIEKYYYHLYNGIFYKQRVNIFGIIDGYNLKERQKELSEALNENNSELKAEKLNTFIQEEQALLMRQTPPLQRSQSLDSANKALRELKESRITNSDVCRELDFTL